MSPKGHGQVVSRCSVGHDLTHICHDNSLDICQQGVELQAMPSQGALLLAHPAMAGTFNRAVVLLCRHGFHQGSYGLIINRAMQVMFKNNRIVVP